jgi:hypothetical protein
LPHASQARESCKRPFDATGATRQQRRLVDIRTTVHPQHIRKDCKRLDLMIVLSWRGLRRRVNVGCVWVDCSETTPPPRTADQRPLSRPQQSAAATKVLQAFPCRRPFRLRASVGISKPRTDARPPWTAQRAADERAYCKVPCESKGTKQRRRGNAWSARSHASHLRKTGEQKGARVGGDRQAVFTDVREAFKVRKPRDTDARVGNDWASMRDRAKQGHYRGAVEGRGLTGWIHIARGSFGRFACSRGLLSV